MIIITVVLMIGVLQRTTASDIIDTSSQNDAVEALFIAETGNEHASYLFANYTTGADLALVGPVTAGRGSFDIDPGTATTAGSFGLPPFTVTAPTALTLNFDCKVVTSGGSFKEARLSFALSDVTSTSSATPAPWESGHTGNYVTGNVTIAIGRSVALRRWRKIVSN